MRKSDERPVSPLEKARTLYEHTLDSDFEIVPEDAQYKYVRVPEDSEAVMVHHFKLGFEPADGHPGNDGTHVVLRIKKELYDKLYAEDAARLKSLLGEAALDDVAKGMSLSRAEYGKEQPLEQILASLPDTDDEE